MRAKTRRRKRRVVACPRTRFSLFSPKEFINFDSTHRVGFAYAYGLVVSAIQLAFINFAESRNEPLFFIPAPDETERVSYFSASFLELGFPAKAVLGLRCRGHATQSSVRVDTRPRASIALPGGDCGILGKVRGGARGKRSERGGGMGT